MITYADFIAELRVLVREAQSLRAEPEMHENPRFRKWRHELESLSDQIARAGYLLPGPVRVHRRAFGYTTGIASDEECLSFYQRDINDSVNELDLIVRNFEKFGEPQKTTLQPVPPTLKPSERSLKKEI